MMRSKYCGNPLATAKIVDCDSSSRRRKTPILALGAASIEGDCAGIFAFRQQTYERDNYADDEEHALVRFNFAVEMPASVVFDQRTPHTTPDVWISINIGSYLSSNYESNFIVDERSVRVERKHESVTTRTQTVPNRFLYVRDATDVHRPFTVEYSSILLLTPYPNFAIIGQNLFNPDGSVRQEDDGPIEGRTLWEQ